MTSEFIHEEASMLFHSEKFLGSGGGGWHCNYSYKVQVSKRFEIETSGVHLEITWIRA